MLDSDIFLRPVSEAAYQRADLVYYFGVVGTERDMCFSVFRFQRDGLRQAVPDLASQAFG